MALKKKRANKVKPKKGRNTGRNARKTARKNEPDGPISPEVFKAYDVRGVYPKQINERLAYLVGKAFVTFLKCRNVVVGRDARTSSPQLHKALVRGITEQGADVIDIGLSTTPMFYFTIANYGYESGIMITASHNPKQYNGLKFCRKDAVPIGGETGINDIRDIIMSRSFSKAGKKGVMKKINPLNDYVKKLLSFAENPSERSFARKTKTRPLKIVVDAGNGMSPVVFPTLAKKLKLETINMYFKIDCSFPNHEANPSKEETLSDLRKRVVKERADYGVAFDGDADRIAFVDEKGEIVPNDLMTAVIAKHLLGESKNRGAKILYEVRSSWAVRDEVLKDGGQPILWKAGHALIKDKMRSENILFGGEKSGHYFYRDFWYADSAMLTFVQVLNIMSEANTANTENTRFSDIINPLRKYSSSGEMNFEVKEKDRAIAEVEKTFKSESKKVFYIDGLTMEFDDWWFNLRKSNTEPLIRLNVEARTKEGLDLAIKRLKNIISEVP